MNQGRWRVLVRTSNSGKRLFVCMVCGRVSATPDKVCPPFAQWSPSGPYTIRCEDMETYLPTPPRFTGENPISEK